MPVFIVRNYNRFLVGSPINPQWEDFYIHRFKTNYKRLLKFDTLKEAEAFLASRPELEEDFDAWIVPANEDFWQ